MTNNMTAAFNALLDESIPRTGERATKPPSGRNRTRARMAGALVSLLLLASIGASGQSSESPDPAASEVAPVQRGELQATDQKVEVDKPSKDSAIAERLTRIYNATGRLRNARVNVDDGVVTLSGETLDGEFPAWAARLARNTESVVAVVNNIRVLDRPLWSFQPAFDELGSLGRQIVRGVPMFAIGLVILLVSVTAARATAASFTRLLAIRLESELVQNVLEKVVFIAVMLVGVYLFLRISGLTQLAVTVVGGTGVLGLILGFAFRDIAENFLASILISVQRPFRIGDSIEVDGHLGVVQRVNMRGTLLMDFDGNHIQIANATVYKSTIKNYTANPKIRVDFAIGIGYDASMVEAQAVAMRVIGEHSAVLEDPAPNILVEELGSSTINLRIYFWIDGQRFSKAKVRSALMRQVVRGFEQAGISLPDDAREVIFPQGVPVRMVSDSEESTAEIGADRAPTEPGREAVDGDDDHEATEAEGDLESETVDIARQAEASRRPEEGEDMLGDARDEPSPTDK